MVKLFKAIFKNKKERYFLNEVKKYLSSESYIELLSFFNTGKICFAHNFLDVDRDITEEKNYPQIYITKEKHLEIFSNIQKLNSEIKENFIKNTFIRFSKKASKVIPQKFCERINDYILIKKAMVLMLLSDKNLNILLLGDREDQIKDLFIECLKNISSDLIIGSGEDLLGLRCDNEGNFISGLMSKADGKILCIKNFEKIDAVDSEFLKIAQEKKTIFINHEDKTHSENTDFMIFAIANTKELRFVSNSPEILNQQISVSQDLQDLFHLRFICRNLSRNLTISDKETKPVVENSSKEKRVDNFEYFRRYMDYVQKLDVAFNTKYNDHIAEYAEKLETLYDSRKYLEKPDKKKIVKVLLRLAIANAKLNMRPEVILDDLVECEEILNYSYMV